MSIDIDRFEKADPSDLDSVTNAERVVAFLATHDDRAWQRSEIAERAGVGQNSIGAVLSRLAEAGLVRHKGKYWAITDDRDRLRDAFDLHRLTERLDDQYGTESKSDWVDE
jgi:Mn-dependent DtxR family transcriptional regulator